MARLRGHPAGLWTIQMPTMGEVALLRGELYRLLERTEKWLIELTAEEDDDGRVRRLAQERDEFEAMRTRAASSMINVGLLGGFSSGKSFLISGLQGVLEFMQVPTSGRKADKYIGLLPSATKPTTACPGTVVPVEGGAERDAGGRGFLRVRFSGDEEWTDIGSSPGPLVVAAYAMQDPERIEARVRPDHMTRQVAEIQVLLSDYRLPAKLYDLPGYGSPIRTHDKVVRDAMVEADCFIYVANATKTLTENELDLIRFLHGRHTHWGKRVIWVLTAIDKAMDLDLDDRPEWQDTLEQNNAYLRENFPLPDGRPDEAFIGGGFVPVSPALEARGRALAAAGRAEEAADCIAESRMDELRALIGDMIEAGAGRRHIADIAGQAHSVIEPRVRVLRDMLEAERIPVEQLATERDRLDRRFDDLKESVDAVRDQLEKSLERRLRIIERGFRRLAPELHGALDERIKEADPRKARQENRLEVLKTQAIHDWLSGPDGADERWRGELDAFTKEVLIALRAALRATDRVDGLDRPSGLDLEQMITAKPRARRTGTPGLMQRLTALVGTGSSAASAAGMAAGALSGPALWASVGVAAGAAVAYAGFRVRARKVTSLDLIRQEWVDHLDEAAEQTRDSFLVAAELAGVELIDRSEEILFDRLNQLSSSIHVLDTRIAAPEIRDRRSLIERLEPRVAEGEDLVAGLAELIKSD